MPAESRASLVSPALLAMLRCPRCKGPLAQDAAFGLRCDACAKQYPIRLGIPDLRVYEDPLIPLADDYAKADKIEARASSTSFAGLVEYYWSLPTYPATPPDLRARFIHHVLTDERRIEGYLDQIGSGRTFLEAGCGTAGLAAAALRRGPDGKSRYEFAVGCDVAFRWLLIARKRLEEAGVPANLVCCCADHLPFEAGAFDAAASVSLLEHMEDAAGAIREFARVTTGNGRLFVWTANRFSIGLEPHVRVWGVGFLPRRWMAAYVERIKGLAYEKKRLLSCFEIRRMLRGAGFASMRFLLPPVTPEDRAALRGIERFGADVFRMLSRVPWIRSLLIVVAPAILVAARRDPGE